MQIITIFDYLLFPLYIVIFYLIVREKAKKYHGTPLRKFFMLAFWLHMLGAIFYAMLMYYYYGYGDSFAYYQGGGIIRDMIVKDPTAVKYIFSSGADIASRATELGYPEIPLSMPNDANAFVMKITAIFSFFSFNSYLVISFFFGFISFIGTWKLFYVMQKLNGGKHIQLLGYATICTPSLWLWGSGLLKEPLCIGCLGFAVFVIHKMFIVKQFKLKNLILLFLLFYCLTIVKSYITAIFIVSVLVVFLSRFFLTIKNLAVRILAISLFIFISGISLMSANIDRYIDDAITASYSQIETFKNSYESVQDFEGSKGGFSIGDIKPTFSSLVLKSPEVIFSCFFRPFIWESGKVIILFAALETFVIFIATLIIFFKTKFFGFFYYSFNNPYRLFCFIFSILFALVVGYTTFNFGTMVRYKIIFLPFYFFLLINIYTTINSKVEKTITKA